MNIPVVLPVIKATVADDGTVSVAISDEPHATDRVITRGGLRKLIDEITTARQCAARVEVTESDGTTYADIATPAPVTDQSAPDATRSQPATLPGLSGTGFRPGERVAVAYVLMEETADDTGTAAVHLPAAVLATGKSAVVLLGLDSNTVTTITTRLAPA